MNDFPSVFIFGGLYFPPLLIVGIVALIMAIMISWVCNEFGLSRFLWHPSLVFVMLILICGSLLSLLIWPI